MAPDSQFRVSLSCVAFVVSFLLHSIATAQPVTKTTPRPVEAEGDGVIEPRSVMLLDLDFTSDGAAVVTVGDAVRVHDVRTGRLVQHFDVSDRLVRTVACSPDSPELFAVGGDDEVIRIYRIGTQQPVQEWEWHGKKVRDIDFSPDGELLVSSGTNSNRDPPANGAVRLWRLDGGQLLHSLNREGTGVSCIAYSSDGQHIALARRRKARDLNATAVAELYDVSDWRLIRSIPFEPGNGFEMDFSRDGDKLLIAGGICVPTGPSSCRPTGKLWVVDLANDRPAQRIEVDQCSYFRSACITPAGDCFATGTTSAPNKPGLLMSVIQMRRMENGEIVWSREGAEGEPYGVTVSPDGLLVAGCTRQQVQILKASTGDLVTTIDIVDAP